MLAYSLLKLAAAHSTFETVLACASSLRNDVKHSFRESVQNLLSWALNSPDRSTDELMHQIEGSSSNVRSQVVKGKQFVRVHDRLRTSLGVGSTTLVGPPPDALEPSNQSYDMNHDLDILTIVLQQTWIFQKRIHMPPMFGYER